MSGIINTISRLHQRFFDALEAATGGWLTGFAARMVFSSVLLLYYFNSAWNKFGDGIFGFLNPTDGAYGAILPPIFEQYGFDAADVPFFPWGLIVQLGTLAELILPILIFIGLFSRIAAIGLTIFIIVQSYVDIAFHGLEGKFVGSMFDRFQDAIIWDQRLLWVFPLLIIILHGPGKLSLDHLLSRNR